MNGNDKEKLVSDSGWRDYKIFVLDSIESIKEHVKGNGTQIVNLKVEVAKLKTNSRNWGALAGTVTGIIGTIVVNFFFKLF